MAETMATLVEEKIYHIDTAYASFGIITPRYTNQVIDAAPIAHWTIGKDIHDVLKYYLIKKCAKITIGYIRREIQ